MISLTPRQQEALRFITGFIEHNGIPPCLREIAVGIGLSVNSKGAMHRIVECLEDRGAITRVGMHRAIAVITPITIPRAPDGEPLRFVPRALDGDPEYFVRIREGV